MKKCKNAIVHVCCVLGLSMGLGLAGATGEIASAQDSLLKKVAVGDKKSPLLLQADEVTYDNQNNRVIAKGNVEIYYNQYALFADTVVYDRAAAKLRAEGNVRIKNPDGSVTNANNIDLTEDFKQGFIESLKVVTKENARIGASKAKRVDENTIIFENTVFTPCKQCKDKKYPLWQIKAQKIIHKKDEGNIYYEGASMELLGIPVAYLPYFSHPDPTVKRRSGFLIPKFENSSDLGFAFELPYFYNLAPNKDFTFNPKVTSKQGVLWQGEWRHRTKSGAYSIKADGIREEDPDQAFDRGEFRGSVHTDGKYRVTDWLRMGWDITAETDDTYRRKYGIEDKIVTDRVSKIYAIGQTERNWFEANLYHFGALTSLDGANADAFVHPVIDYNHIFGNPVFGGELSFDTNILSLSRHDGSDTNRMIAQLKWRKTMIDSLGQVYQPFFQARGDIYHVSNATDPQVQNEFITQGQVLGGMTYSYPFVARTRHGSHIVEPIAQIVARPDVGITQGLPNEDAKSLVFDDTILFDVDKFSGYDRQEEGTRANVGLRYTLQLNSGGYARAVFGQSYHLSGNNSYDKGTGLGTDKSDYVTALYLEPSKNFTLMSQARFDENNFDLKRTDVFARASYGPVTGSVNYANVDASADTQALGITQDREEVLASASLQISDYWSIFGSLRYNLADEEFIQDAIGIQYADECFVLAVTYNESFIEDEDIKADQKVMVRFELKHIGGTSIQTSVADDLFTNIESSN